MTSLERAEENSPKPGNKTIIGLAPAHSNFSITEVLDKMDSAYRDVYKDRHEIQNFNQDGSFFYRMNEVQVLKKITEQALAEGLDPDMILEFVKGSNIWEDLGKLKQKELLAAFLPSDVYFPGPIHIVKTLTERFYFKTIPEIGSDREQIWGFNGQVYEKFEEKIKEEAQKEYIAQWEAMKKKVEQDETNRSLQVRLNEALDRGPSINDISEVLAMVRRTTFTSEQMNPPTHIPFQNCLVNIETGKPEPFTPSKFFSFQVKANYLGQHVTLKDAPLFYKHLQSTFFCSDIPMVLSYQAYALYPGFPVHKVLWIVGPPRVGKGVSARIIQGLIPKGTGSISLSRLLTADRFYFQNIQGKNLLIDGETSRVFRRGTPLNWARFTNLFGGDILDLEEKGKNSKEYVSSAKGIMIFNQPMMVVDDPPAITRILLVQTKSEKPSLLIPYLDRLILNSESDQIATLLVQILFKLKARNFLFPGEMTAESTARCLDQLADPVENFIQEEIEEIEYDNDQSEDSEGNINARITVDDVFTRFEKWCSIKGIVVMKRQRFVKKFGDAYQKRRLGPKDNRKYFFVGCAFKDNYTIKAKKKDATLSSWTPSEPKIASEAMLSGQRYRSVQHVYTTSCHEKNTGLTIIEEGDAQKSDTNLTDAKSPINKVPEDIKTVSNLRGHFKEPLEDSVNGLTPEVVNTYAQDGKTSLANIKRLDTIDHECVRLWLKSVLTTQLSADDLLIASGNPDLRLGFLIQVLTYDSEDFLQLANNKWIIRTGPLALYGVIKKFVDSDSHWYEAGTTILLRPGAGNTLHYMEKGLIYGPIAGLDDPEFRDKVNYGND